MTYRVVDGSVGRSVRFAVTATWPVQLELAAAVEGTVTSVTAASTSTVAAGDSPLAIDLRPVTIAEGSTPMFRALRVGDRGPDVEQLQRFLRARPASSSVPVDGVFAQSTAAAVSAWQGELGLVADGTVQPGDLAFVPTLPARIAVLAKVGQRVSPGAPLIQILEMTPRLTIRLSDEQRLGLPADPAVRVTGPGGVWAGRFGTVVPAADGNEVELIAPGGGAVCAAECGAVSPPAGDYVAEVEVVPAASGPVVPVGAILTRADGTSVVTTEQGEVPVEIVAAADGLAVVRGVHAGQVLLLATPPDAGS